MRRALEFLFTRVLRSRLGIGLVLAVLVLGIVGAARVLSGPLTEDSGLISGPREPISTVDPETGDDGVLGPDTPPSPSTSPGADAPAVVARDFATAWLNHRGVTADQWHAALVPLATRDLADQLVGVDPATVPADRLTGDPVIIPQTEGFVEATMTVDSGKLRLELLAPDGRWLVDAVDWERG